MHRNRTEKWQDGLSVDFSAESERKYEIKQALLQRLSQQDAAKRGNEKEYSPMHPTNNKRFKRSTVIALAACVAFVVLSASAYAIVSYLNLGQHAQYILNDQSASEEAAQMAEPLPAGLQGRLYDKNGKVIEKVGELQSGAYNASGEPVVIRDDEFGNPVITTQEEERQKQAKKTTLFNRLEDAQPYLAFDARPFTYIPAGYALEGYRIYNDENGKPYQGIKYLELYFYQSGNKDEYIYVQARLMDEETAFASSASNGIEKTSINGYEAVLDGSNVDILIGDVMYMIAARDLPQSEAIKMAESLTK